MDANKVGSLLPQQFGGILLGKLIGANMNSTADQQITMFSNPSKFILRRIVVTNASISLSTAAGGVYTAASKGGTAVVAAARLTPRLQRQRFSLTSRLVRQAVQALQ